MKRETLLDTKMRIKTATEERQRRGQEGIGPELLKSLKIPEKPGSQTVRTRELPLAKL